MAIATKPDSSPQNNGSKIFREITDYFDADDLKRVQLRLYASKIAEIDEVVSALKLTRKRKRNFSRHNFLEEAIDEKLERERELLTKYVPK